MGLGKKLKKAAKSLGNLDKKVYGTIANPAKALKGIGNKLGLGAGPSAPDLTASNPADQQAIQDLATNQNKLIGIESAREKQQGEQFMQDEMKRRQEQRAKLAGLLTNMGNQAFTLAKPGIEEDLSAQGLLHSSGLGEAFAREQGNIANQQQNILSNAELGDIDQQSQIAQALLQNQLGLGQSGLQNTMDLQQAGLERQFGLGDLQGQQSMEDYLAKKKQKSDLLNSLIGAGGNVLGGFLGGK